MEDLVMRIKEELEEARKPKKISEETYKMIREIVQRAAEIGVLLNEGESCFISKKEQIGDLVVIYPKSISSLLMRKLTPVEFDQLEKRLENDKNISEENIQKIHELLNGNNNVKLEFEIK